MNVPVSSPLPFYKCTSAHYTVFLYVDQREHEAVVGTGAGGRARRSRVISWRLNEASK